MLPQKCLNFQLQVLNFKMKMIKLCLSELNTTEIRSLGKICLSFVENFKLVDHSIQLNGIFQKYYHAE